MKDRYIELSGTEFDEASDIAIKLKTLAGEIFNAMSNLEWLKNQMFAATAGGEYLDYIATQRGLERIPAAKAKGTLYFKLDEAMSEEVVIPQGTVASTNEKNPVRVYTTETAVIPPLTLSVTVPAEAENAGFAGNISASSAYVPVNVPACVSEVGNHSTFRGGRDVESDSSLRQRIKDTYMCVPNGMNCAYYAELAKTVDGVDKAGVVPRARGTGTLNVYVSGNESDVSNETLAEVSELLNSNREINLNLLVERATYLEYDLTVAVTAKRGYSDEEVEDKISSAFMDYLGSLPAGGRLYLSALGKYLLETDCIENYEFDDYMESVTAPGSQYFAPGEISIEVTR